MTTNDFRESRQTKRKTDAALTCPSLWLTLALREDEPVDVIVDSPFCCCLGLAVAESVTSLPTALTPLPPSVQ